MLEQGITPEETDASEFGQLIRQAVNKEIPAYVEGSHVFLTNGVKIKDGGRAIKEVQETDDPEMLNLLFLKVTNNLGRNDPCYCGSGKKYKKCHMLTEQIKGVC